VAQVWFARSEIRAWRAGDDRVLAGWLWHLPALAAVLAWVWAAPMSLGQYVAAAYIGNALLRIRTYAEHQAHALSRARTVIIEDRGPLAFLFLNNNFHVVHHAHPGLPWYALRARFLQDRARYLSLNEGYRFSSYAELFRRHLVQAKDPVPHPIWRRG
jgi:fatty acid desaturase